MPKLTQKQLRESLAGFSPQSCPPLDKLAAANWYWPSWRFAYPTSHRPDTFLEYRGMLRAAYRALSLPLYGGALNKNPKHIP